MINGSENKERRGCWIERTELEKGLVALLIIATLLISTLGVLLFLYTTRSTDECQKPSRNGDSSCGNDSDLTPEPCDSQLCLKSALEILSRIDTNIDPCEDFYAFACQNISSDGIVGFQQMEEKEKSRIEKMYQEPIQDDDHPLVKVQKTMYHACMNETAVGKDAFSTLKEVLKTVGGWPVIDDKWNEAKFDWVQTTYKLRQLGYTYTSFLEVKIVPDPNNTEKFIYEVAIPEVRDIYSKWFDSNESNGFMADVAAAFGTPIHGFTAEMGDTDQFLKDLQWHRNAIMEDKVTYHRTTVAQFQRRENAINWLQFINTIVGAEDKRVSKNDMVLFPKERGLDQWFGILGRTPKRILANYMLWRVVEEALPYLTEQLQNSGVRPRLMANTDCESRSEFCIREIRKRFSPSPIDIMYLRKYLSEEKRQAVEELANNMNSALIEILKEVEWINPEDKKNATETLKASTIMVGAPGNYFDDAIFDKKFGMNISSNSFLKMLSEANRNKLDGLYSLIDKSTEETQIIWKDVMYNPIQYVEGNYEMLIPACMVQDPLFNENQPNYLNYANMGIQSKDAFLRFFKYISNQTKEAFINNIECLVHSALSENASIPENFLIYELVTYNLGVKVAHVAYEKWAKGNEEPSLAAIDYSPEQLIWISHGYSFCRTTDIPEFRELYFSLASTAVNNNPDLAQVFGCPEKPEVTCKLF